MEKDYPYDSDSLDQIFFSELDNEKGRLKKQYEEFLKKSQDPKFPREESAIIDDFRYQLDDKSKRLFCLSNEEGDGLENQSVKSLYDLMKDNRKNYTANKIDGFFRDSRNEINGMLNPEQELNLNNKVDKEYKEFIKKPDVEIVKLFATKLAYEEYMDELYQINNPITGNANIFGLGFASAPIPSSNPPNTPPTNTKKEKGNPNQFSYTQAAILLEILYELSEGQTFEAAPKKEYAIFGHLFAAETFPKEKNNSGIYGSFGKRNTKKTIVRDYTFIEGIMANVPTKEGSFLDRMKKEIKRLKEEELKRKSKN